MAPLTFWARRRVAGKLQAASLTVLAVLFMGTAGAVLSGCGGGSMLFGNTPKGSYTVTVTAVATGNANYTYTNNFAPGCAITPTPANPLVPTNPATCAETATVNLVVK